MRILHAKLCRASAFFIYFKKSAVCIFRVVLTTRIEHRTRGSFAAGGEVCNRDEGSSTVNGGKVENSC